MLKQAINHKIKKVIWNLIKPFLPFVILFVFLFFLLLCGVQLFFDDYTNGNNYADTDGFVWPVTGYGNISSDYGYRIHPIKHRISFHDGIDIPAPQDTPVLSPDNGVVKECYYSNTLGNTVKIESGIYQFVFYHLNFYTVTENQNIEKGSVIGGVGTTGTLSTGNHLHFSVYENGELINPLKIINFNN